MPEQPDTRPIKGKMHEAFATRKLLNACSKCFAAIEALVEHAGNATLRDPENEDAKAFAHEAENIRESAVEVLKRTYVDASPMTLAGAVCQLAEQADSAAYNAEQAWAAVGGE